MITNGPMNVTVCSGTNATISCGFTGVSDPLTTLPNWSWRIIKRKNDGYIISNETVMDINANKTNGSAFIIISSNMNGTPSANLSVGPVDDTYNNTSYQCIFTINDTIIESDTAGTVTVIGMLCIHTMYVRICMLIINLIQSDLISCQGLDPLLGAISLKLECLMISLTSHLSFAAFAYRTMA